MDTLIRWSWIFGLIGVTALLGALATWSVLGTLDGAPTWFLIGGGVSLLLYGVLDRERVGETVRSRSFVYGSGSSLMVVMTLAIAVAAYLLAREHDKTWDLTTSGDFTLSDQTARVVGAIDEPVTVLAFFRNDSAEQRDFRDLILRYQELSPNLEVDFVDPLRNPRLAEQHEVTSDTGVVVLKTADGDVRRIETEPTEEKLTNALVLLLSDEEHRICWSLGHGEPDPDDEYSERGMGNVVTALESLNYQVTKTTVATTGIDRACEALVVARPQTDWLPYEREALAAYLAEGGRVLVMLEPGLTPELADELARYGVDVGADMVLDFDPENMLLGVDDPTFAVLNEDDIVPHPITRDLAAAVILRISRSVRALEGRPEGLAVQELLRTSDESWGETSADVMEVQPDPGEVMGPVPVAVAVEIGDPGVLEVAAPPADADGGAGAAGAGPDEGAAAEGNQVPAREPGAPGPGEAARLADASRGVPADFAPQAGGRLVVVGDSDFANNVFLAWGNNRDLFLNSVAWLVEEEEQIGERPDRNETLEITSVGEAMLCLVSVFLVPGAAVFLAAATLLRRRYL